MTPSLPVLQWLVGNEAKPQTQPVKARKRRGYYAQNSLPRIPTSPVKAISAPEGKSGAWVA